MPFQQEAFFETPDKLQYRAGTALDRPSRGPHTGTHFVAMGEIPRIYRDLAGARKSLFLALRSGKLRANGIFWAKALWMPRRQYPAYSMDLGQRRVGQLAAYTDDQAFRRLIGKRITLVATNY